jgi:hypothetical protein
VGGRHLVLMHVNHKGAVARRSRSWYYVDTRTAMGDVILIGAKAACSCLESLAHTMVRIVRFDNAQFSGTNETLLQRSPDESDYWGEGT